MLLVELLVEHLVVVEQVLVVVRLELLEHVLVEVLLEVGFVVELVVAHGTAPSSGAGKPRMNGAGRSRIPHSCVPRCTARPALWGRGV
ncbi:MAG: hypothetical protein KatS3mg010_0306 [Acidimicrobiia bacterium]|nr:MAG: hypothetical protein KatS3mg010_0306 [Acidimicrobiia bacterium]